MGEWCIWLLHWSFRSLMPCVHHHCLRHHWFNFDFDKTSAKWSHCCTRSIQNYPDWPIGELQLQLKTRCHICYWLAQTGSSSFVGRHAYYCWSLFWKDSPPEVYKVKNASCNAIIWDFRRLQYTWVWFLLHTLLQNLQFSLPLQGVLRESGEVVRFYFMANLRDLKHLFCPRERRLQLTPDQTEESIGTGSTGRLL